MTDALEVFSQLGDKFSAEGVRTFFETAYRGDYDEVFGPETEYGAGRSVSGALLDALEVSSFTARSRVPREDGDR